MPEQDPGATDDPCVAEAGSPVTCRLRRSSRAKRLRLLVKPGLIELVAPLAVPEATALSFLAQHRDWAETKAREFLDKVRSRPPAKGFCDLATVPWQGRELPLLIRECIGRRVRVTVDETVRIDLPEGFAASKDHIAKRAFYLWVRPRLAVTVTELAAEIGRASGLMPRQIRVKAMKTRWGSCGPRNDININWLLALVPPEVLRYVVIHELCHIRERNHSSAFWALVRSHCPNYLHHRQWLRANGMNLLQRFPLTP